MPKKANPPPSLRTLARLAGVSAMTASRALNGTGAVEESTRKRIVKLARRLGYDPARHVAPVPPEKRRAPAQVLFLGRKTVETELRDETPFHSTVFFRLQTLLENRGHRIMAVDPDGDWTGAALGATAWIFVNRAGLDALRGIPAARRARHLFSVDQPNPFGVEVGMDEGLTAKIVADAFHERGHRRVGVHGKFEGPANLIQSRRLLAFREAFEGDVVVLDAADAKDPFARMLRGKERPTAIYATGGHFALRAHQRLLADGFSIPRDVSLVGFDDFSFYRHLDVEITRVCADLETIATELAKRILAALEGETLDATKRIRVPPLWKPGASLAAPSPSVPRNILRSKKATP